MRFKQAAKWEVIGAKLRPMGNQSQALLAGEPEKGLSTEPVSEDFLPTACGDGRLNLR
jgi:hypothetical protein